MSTGVTVQACSGESMRQYESDKTIEAVDCAP
jgi:hypothetical protein